MGQESKIQVADFFQSIIVVLNFRSVLREITSSEACTEQYARQFDRTVVEKAQVSD